MQKIDQNQALMHELEPEIVRLYNNHDRIAKEWFPHELIPDDLDRKYGPYPLPDGVRSALFVNCLTEDNLPYYYATISSWSPSRDHPWGVWTRRWTSEEARHSIVIRDWILKTRALDPRALEIGRDSQMRQGKVPEPDSVPGTLVYVSLQELATRVTHANTGRHLGEERGGDKVMARVAADEHLHHVFYRDLATAAFSVDPSAMVIAAFEQLKDFKMPGTGIDNFKEHEKAIAEAGIYNLEKFRKNVVEPTFQHWGIDRLEGLSPEAELARKGLFRRLAAIDKAIAHERARHEENPAV